MNNQNPAYIYGLYCPLDGTLKYVGLTNNPPAPLTTEQIREGLDNAVWYRHDIATWDYYILRRNGDTIYLEIAKGGLVHSIAEFPATDDITHIVEQYAWRVDFDPRGYYKKS